MKYALLVFQSQEIFDRRDQADVAAGRAYGEALQAAGIFIGGAGLESPQAATTVTIRDGKRQVHDGPYAETKEFLAGFGIIDVPDLDAALEWAARHPAAGYCSIEIRPLLGSHFSAGTSKSA
ncbi:MAG TPA: YciI family protein [Blastocatellia bacterium]|nr:YciI family protein [Blastocatellia bacterium]